MILFRCLFISFLSILAAGCNPRKIKIGEPYNLGGVPEEITKVQATQDPFATGLKVEMTDLPGHDDVIFDHGKNIGYASSMDGWIWKLDFTTGHADRWAHPPVNPAGMQFSGPGKEKILFCASRLGGESYDAGARVGLYEADTATGQIKPVLLDLPRVEKEEFEKVYPTTDRPSLSVKNLNSANSRPFSLCNDLAISSDGNHIFISEPFEREDAAMGSGAVPEAIGLYPHGKLWMYDRKSESVSLILGGFTFVDGILLEEKSGDVESVLFTETTKFRILRAYLSGINQGKSEVLFENLPGLADGLERDAKGRIWAGIIKQRSGLVNVIHRNPWLKSFLLSLPQGLLPISKKTGFLVLDASARQPLYYFMHDGAVITDISVAVPQGDRVYFPTFNASSRGLYSLSISDLHLTE